MNADSKACARGIWSPMADERAAGQNADGAFYAMAQPLRRKALAEALGDAPTGITPARHTRR